MTKEVTIEQINIRQSLDGDFKEIDDLLTQAFNGSDESILVNALRKSANFIQELSIVAVLDHKVIGFILFSKIWIVDSEKKSHHPSLALAPVAVLPAYQNNEIGSKLIEYGINQAKALGHDSIIVLGHATYYPRFGFNPAHLWNITTHYEVAAENFMALELLNDALNNVSGLVKYPKEFERFDGGI